MVNGCITPDASVIRHNLSGADAASRADTATLDPSVSHTIPSIACSRFLVMIRLRPFSTLTATRVRTPGSSALDVHAASCVPSGDQAGRICRNVIGGLRVATMRTSRV